MAAKIVVPELGESVIEATVGRWLKNEGEPVTLGEPVVELETEKVDLEVGAEKGGVLARIERKQGENVKIGDVLGVIEETRAASAPPSADTASSERSPAAAARPQPEPSDGRKRATVEVQASVPGPVKGTLNTRVSELPPDEVAEPLKKASSQFSTPSARKLAREQGVDLSHVPLRDAAGRLTTDDISGYLKEQQRTGAEAGGRSMLTAREPRPERTTTDFEASPSATAPREPAPAKPGLTVPPGERGEERVRMSRRRQTIARRLVEAQHSAAMLTTFNEVDMSAVMELRKRQKESFRDRHGVALGIVSFFVKASIAALRQFPRLNAEIRGDEMVLKHYFDVGIAVGASGGLVVPVLRDADRMSFAQIEAAIKDFARKAEDGSLTLEDLKGGTFTITNGGVFGSLLSTPILNPPQVGILGLHKIQERPVVVKAEVLTRPMMYVALSYDHRIVDGAEAVQFLVRVKQLVEEPGMLLLEG